MTQTHHKFKIFTGPLGADGALGALSAAVEDFVRKSGVSAKSIGAEYLEQAGSLLVTLGYRDDEPGAPVQLRSVPVGKLEKTPDFGALEAALGQAAAAQRNIICHELYVTADHQLHMIFMTLA